MHRKRSRTNGDERQLSIPFKNNNTSISTPPSKDNIVCFSSKIEEINNSEENKARKRSINRLLSSAEKLNW